MEHLLSKIENPEIERIVFVPDCYGSNMSLKYGYSNIGFFTSSRNREVLKSMYRLGYNVQMDEQLWITSYSGTFFNYSMVGVKYYVTKEELKDDIFGFEFEEKFEDFYIYKNRNNFGIGFYMKEDIEESYNPLKMQNDILNSMSNLSHKESYFAPIEQASCLKCDKNLSLNNETGEYSIKYKIKALDNCSIYIASDYNLQVYINGEPKFKDYSNIWSTETGVKQIKNLKVGEDFEFAIKTKQNLELLYVWVSDNNKIQDVLNKKEERNYYTNERIKSNGLEGSVHFKDDGILCFSISYDDNWKVYIDGVEAEKVKVYGAFLGVKCKSGDASFLCFYKEN